MPAKTQLLRNRVMLITEPVVQAKTAAIGFWFSVGSRYEKKGEYGITHFTEHMIFKGTSSLTSHDISSEFDKIGGYINAFTEREDVCVYCTVPSDSSNYSHQENIEKALSIMCDMAENSTFDKEEMEKERAVIQNEIVAVDDDAEEAALDEVAEAVWPKQSISRKIGGSVKDVEAITRKAICAWYEKWFAKGELVVCAAGRFNEKKIIELLEKLTLHLEPKKYPMEKHFGSGNVKWHSGPSSVTAKFKQGQYFVLYPFATPVSEKNYYTMSVFNAVAGDSMCSRLFESLREKSGLCYNVYSFFTFYENACAWCAYATSEKSKVKKVMNLLFDEISKLKSSYPTDDEIEIAKQHLVGEETISSENMEYRMKRLARNFQMGLSLFNTEEVSACIQKVTKQDIIHLIDVLLMEEHQAYLIYGPKNLTMKENKK